MIDPIVGPFMLGQLIATGGIWVFSIIATILVWDMTGSPVMVGLTGVAQYLPHILLSLWSGARADAGDRRAQLVVGRLLVSVGALTVIIWVSALGLRGTPGAIGIIVSSAIAGIGFAVGGPALHALIPDMVKPSELGAAIALNSIPNTLARAAGPAVGALFVVRGIPGTGFFVAALANAVFALIVWRLPISVAQYVRTGDRRIRFAFNYVRSHRALFALLVGVFVIGVGADPAITLSPPLAAQLGGGAPEIGLLASAFGSGAGLAFFLIGPGSNMLGLPRLATTGVALMALGTLSLAVATTVPVAAASLFLSGVGLTIALAGFTTLIQQRSPDDLRGRIMALWSVAFLGSRPFAAGVSGLVADAFSVRTALLLTLLVLILGGLTSRPSRTTLRAASDAGGD